ncbi:MAG: hypothetical protein WCV88_02835 [Patescibacteria group bacterium]
MYSGTDDPAAHAGGKEEAHHEPFLPNWLTLGYHPKVWVAAAALVAVVWLGPWVWEWGYGTPLADPEVVERLQWPGTVLAILVVLIINAARKKYPDAHSHGPEDADVLFMLVVTAVMVLMATGGIGFLHLLGNNWVKVGDTCWRLYHCPASWILIFLFPHMGERSFGKGTGPATVSTVIVVGLWAFFVGPYVSDGWNAVWFDHMVLHAMGLNHAWEMPDWFLWLFPVDDHLPPEWRW